MRSQVLVAIVVALLACGSVPSGSAFADAIDFAGLAGGTVSYAGGATPLIGTSLPINLVFAPGVPTLAPVIGGVLNFVTGNFSGGTDFPGPSFGSQYGAGGSITITGGVPSAGIAPGTLLLSAVFTTPADFKYYVAGAGSMAAGLSASFVSTTLANYFGYAPPPTGGGSFAQVDFLLNFNGATPAPGLPFSGTQGSVNVLSTTPEPTSLLLLGVGLTGLGILRRRRFLKRT